MKARLHIDWMDYAEALIGGGKIDWSSPVAVSGLINKAQALLPSDGVILPLGNMLRALGQSVDLATKTSGVAALRALLANNHSRMQILEAVTLVRVPALALGLPAPADCIMLAAALAGHPPPDVHDAMIEDAALYMADFLRIFANATLEAVVLTETMSAAPWRHFYSPVKTVVSSYGWTFSVAAPDAPLWPGFHTVVIPPDGKPEDVLALVRALKHKDAL